MNFGQNFQNAMMTQVGAIFLTIIGVLAIYFLVKKEFSRFLGFAAFSLIVSVFVFAPNSIKTLGSSLWKVIFG